MTLTPGMNSEPVIERLVRIETKLDISNQTSENRIKLEDERYVEHDAYITSLREAGLPNRFIQLEQEVAVLKGNWKWLAGAGFVASLVVGLFGASIAQHFFG